MTFAAKMSDKTLTVVLTGTTEEKRRLSDAHWDTGTRGLEVTLDHLRRRSQPKRYYSGHELCIVLYCMSKATGDPERAINDLLSVAQLLEEPRLARLYTYILREGEVTIDEIVADIDTPRTTAYADTGTLVDLGVLTRDETQKTHTYMVIPISLTANLDGDTYTITPTLVEAIDRSPQDQDQDLDLLIEKHGVGELAAALTYAIRYVEGRMTDRLAARDLNLQPAFGIAVLQALREVIFDMREYDPYFDQIRNARDKPVDEEA
jgi:Sugar-specific transcriptional regulator TrmB.